jgi:lipocalin
MEISLKPDSVTFDDFLILVMKYLTPAFCLFCIMSCTAPKELYTVSELDLEKYKGTWYEIARLPNSFEKGLKCVTANYSIKDNGKINVLNKGYSTKKEKYKTANGTAWVPDSKYPARLKVRFFWPFAGNYYVITLDEDYSYALVGDPSRKYLWVLSRTKILDRDIFNELLDVAASKGFEVSSMIRVEQDCD